MTASYSRGFELILEWGNTPGSFDAKFVIKRLAWPTSISALHVEAAFIQLSQVKLCAMAGFSVRHGSYASEMTCARLPGHEAARILRDRLAVLVESGGGK